MKNKHPNIRRAAAAAVIIVGAIWAKSFADGEVFGGQYEPAPHADNGAPAGKNSAPHSGAPHLQTAGLNGPATFQINFPGNSHYDGLDKNDGAIGTPASPDYDDTLNKLTGGSRGDWSPPHGLPYDPAFTPLSFSAPGGGGGGGGNGNGPHEPNPPSDPPGPNGLPGPNGPQDPSSPPPTFPTGPGEPPISAVPEPATWAMFLLGFGAIGFMLRKARRQNPGATLA